MMRSLKFLNLLALVALALCFSAGLGKAQDAYKGTFTLPFEAHWAGAVLPGGEYTISMPSTNAPFMLFVRGEGKSVVILANGWADRQLSDDSKLTVVNMDGTETIAHLEAGQLGLTFRLPTSQVPHEAYGRGRDQGRSHHAQDERRRRAGAGRL